MQNVKAVFDAAIKVVIKPPQKQKEKKKPRQGCLVLVTISFKLCANSILLSSILQATQNYFLCHLLASIASSYA
jgi:hypothetical protein